MDKLLKLISLDSLRGIRTKVTILVDVALYAVSALAPQYLSPDAWEKLQPVFISLAAFFGLEHFEKKE